MITAAGNPACPPRRRWRPRLAALILGGLFGVDWEWRQVGKYLERRSDRVS